MGIYFIWHRMKPLKVVCDRQKWLIEVPGNVTTLVLLLSIFFSRFTFGFLSATHPELKANFLFSFTEILISGAACGIAFGRPLSLLVKFFKSAHVDLKETT